MRAIDCTQWLYGHRKESLHRELAPCRTGDSNPRQYCGLAFRADALPTELSRSDALPTELSRSDALPTELSRSDALPTDYPATQFFSICDTRCVAFGDADRRYCLLPEEHVCMTNLRPLCVVLFDLDVVSVD